MEAANSGLTCDIYFVSDLHHVTLVTIFSHFAIQSAPQYIQRQKLFAFHMKRMSFLFDRYDYEREKQITKFSEGQQKEFVCQNK